MVVCGGFVVSQCGLVADWWRYEQAIQAEQARVAASSMTLQQPLWLAGLNMPSGTVLQASVSDDARLMEPHDFYRANFPVMLSGKACRFDNLSVN